LCIGCSINPKIPSFNGKLTWAISMKNNYKISTQLKNAEAIKKILKKVSVTFSLHDGRVVDTSLIYLPISSSEISYTAFFEEIKNGILHNFVFSCKEVQEKLGVESKEAAEKLFEKAIRKLSQHTAKGELGELILFTLLDVYFKAPKILSKISFKTNPRMPVFGADAVHCQFHGGVPRLYLGESKLHKSFKSAATDAAKSMANTQDKYQDEFDLLDSHMDFENIDENIKYALLDVLDPFSDNDLSEVIHLPCFIGFAEPDLMSSIVSEEEFVGKYNEIAADYIGDFFEKVEQRELDIDKTALFLLPFLCVDDLVEQFIKYIGIKK
jgi:hypothetical protein